MWSSNKWYEAPLPHDQIVVPPLPARFTTRPKQKRALAVVPRHHGSRLPALLSHNPHYLKCCRFQLEHLYRLIDKGSGWDLIISEEVLHTILIELHLQVSSFNSTIVFHISSSWSNCRCLKLQNGNWIYRKMYNIFDKNVSPSLDLNIILHL